LFTVQETAVAGPPVEVQVRVNIGVVAFSSDIDVSWNWREVMLSTPGECERRLKLAQCGKY